MPKEIIRGDSYGASRPVYIYTLVDELLAPLDLTGYTIQTTYKPAITTIEEDASDTTAEIMHEIQFDGSGNVVYQDGIYIPTGSTVADGILHDRLTKVETAALPVGTELTADLQVTDPSGEVFTWLFDDTLVARDGVTHRAPATP
jgi:hypothetical protein